MMETQQDILDFIGDSFADSKTKVSLILSGGADLAVFFQLGAINILQDHMGMKPEDLHLIAGGSGGAISGLLTAGGVNSDKTSLVPSLEQVLQEEKRGKKRFEKLGFYSQDGVVKHIENMLGDRCRHFKDLPVDLRIASTMVFPRLKKVIFSRDHCHYHGREITTYEAMKCSITVPLLYTPVEIANGRFPRSYHLDGEIFKPIPIEEGRDSDVMIIISVYGPYRGSIPFSKLPQLIENRFNHWRQREMDDRMKKIRSYNPDITILKIENAPDDYETATFEKFSMKNVETLKAAGRRAAWKVKQIA